MQLRNLLDSFKVKEDELNSEERATLEKWYEAWQKQELTVEKIKDFNEALIHAIEKEIASPDHPPKNLLFLQARLKDRLMMRDFLTGPEKAKKHIEAALENLKK